MCFLVGSSPHLCTLIGIFLELQPLEWKIIGNSLGYRIPDPGSWILDPGSRILVLDPGSRIPAPGSGILQQPAKCSGVRTEAHTPHRCASRKENPCTPSCTPPCTPRCKHFDCFCYIRFSRRWHLSVRIQSLVQYNEFVYICKY